MNDRGENIVRLAREILSSPPETRLETIKKAGFPMPCKYLIFTALVASAIIGGIFSLAVNEHLRPVTHYEMVELNALIFYAAKNGNRQEDELRAEIMANIGSKEDGVLSAADFRRAKSAVLSKF